MLSILNLIFIVVAIIFFIWYSRYSYKIYYFLEQNDVTQDDYSVLIEGIPLIIFDEETSTVENANFNYRKLIKKTVE